MLRLFFKQKENIDQNVKEVKDFHDDVIFHKIDIKNGDIVRLNENQIILLVKDGNVLDLKEEVGNYVLESSFYIDKKYIDELQDVNVPKAEDTGVNLIFLNLSTINNKYNIDDPIKYVDWQSDKEENVNIKLNGNYTLQIEEPKKFIQKVIGLRRMYTKQELVEKIRKDVLKSIEEGINEVSDKYKIKLEDLPAESKKVEVSLKENQYDKVLYEDFGVRVTYFDIDSLEVVRKKSFFGK